MNARQYHTSKYTYTHMYTLTHKLAYRRALFDTSQYYYYYAISMVCVNRNNHCIEEQITFEYVPLAGPSDILLYTRHFMQTQVVCKHRQHAHTQTTYVTHQDMHKTCTITQHIQHVHTHTDIFKTCNTSHNTRLGVVETTNWFPK